MYLSQIDLIKPRAKFYDIGSPSFVLNMMADCTTAIFLICLHLHIFSLQSMNKIASLVILKVSS